MTIARDFALLALVFLTVGCQTTNSVPYKASMENVIAIQKSLKSAGKTVSVGTIELADGVRERPLCRLNGPIQVSPGKSIQQFIQEAFQEELFMAQVYQADASTVIDGRIEGLSFSSVTPANWNMSMSVKSNHSDGYEVSVKHKFATSYAAWAACENVANAFGPAVQALLRAVVTHPKFSELAN
jgi:hypothetical protein